MAKTPMSFNENLVLAFKKKILFMYLYCSIRLFLAAGLQHPIK